MIVHDPVREEQPTATTNHENDRSNVSGVLNLLSLATAMGALATVRKLKRKGIETDQKTKDTFNDAVARSSGRLLPGAKIIRSGRPMTDIMTKIKKRQRRALMGSAIAYRKSNKSAIKSLVNSTRNSAHKAYR